MLRVTFCLARWTRPVLGCEHYQWVAGHSGHGKPSYFDEFIAPRFAASTHTATLRGDVLFVLGGDEARRAVNGL